MYVRTLQWYFFKLAHIYAGPILNERQADCERKAHKVALQQQYVFHTAKRVSLRGRFVVPQAEILSLRAFVT